MCHDFALRSNTNPNTVLFGACMEYYDRERNATDITINIVCHSVCTDDDDDDDDEGARRKDID